jgi:hypothetical protein
VFIYVKGGLPIKKAPKEPIKEPPIITPSAIK